MERGVAGGSRTVRRRYPCGEKMSGETGAANKSKEVSLLILNSKKQKGYGRLYIKEDFF